MNLISTDYMHSGLLINDNDIDMPLRRHIIMYYTHLCIDLLQSTQTRGLDVPSKDDKLQNTSH